MVWRSISLSVAQKQLLVGCREQLGIKDSEFESKVLHSFKTANWNKKNVVLKCKKMFLFEKIDKNVQFNSVSRKFLKFLCPCKVGCFFIWGLKMLSVWSGVFFIALEMRARKAYRKETRSNASFLLNKGSALEHDRFKQVSLYTTSCGYLQILKSKS